MICPQCQADNRDDRTQCYDCSQDLTVLRQVIARSREHFNAGLEHAERNRHDEAISEIKHALELDASFVNAWVVLGTVYARQEKFDEAQKAWQSALAINPQYQRCHEYLTRAQRVSQSLPAIQRLRSLVVGLGAAAVLLLAGCIALFLFQIRPDPAADGIDSALSLRDQKRTGDALAAAERAANHLLAPARSRRAAEFIKSQIQKDIEAQLDSVRTMASGDDFSASISAIDALKALAPPTDVATEIERLRAGVLDRVTARARETAAAFEKGEVPFAVLRDRIQTYKPLFGNDPRAEGLDQLLAVAKKKNEDRVEAQARDEVRQAKTLAEAAGRIDALVASNPELKEKLETTLQNLLRAQADTRATELDRAVAAGNLDKGQEILVQIEALYSGIDRKPPPDLLAPLRQKIEDAQRTRKFELVRRSYEERNWEGLLERTNDIDKAGWNEEQRKLLGAWRREALDEFSRGFWDWSQSLDVQFETGRITHEQALRMIDNFELVLDPLGTAFKRSHILFRAAAAYFYKLSDRAKAAELIARLEKQYPEAKIVQYKAYKDFKKKIAESAPPK